jgi:hypothetical protein
MFDIHQSIFDEVGEGDSERRQVYLDGLLGAFVKSAEAQELGPEARPGHYSDMFLRYDFDYLGVPVPELSESDAREVLFELIPRKVSIEPIKAHAIVVELRAFFTFLDRQFGLRNAKRIAAMLDDKAERRLREELADPANYGMAKSFVMQGIEAGYDMTSPEGMNAFMEVFNQRLLSARMPAQLPLRPIIFGDFGPERDRAEVNKRRKARKAQRQARKRNRR